MDIFGDLDLGGKSLSLSHLYSFYPQKVMKKIFREEAIQLNGETPLFSGSFLQCCGRLFPVF
jgi:hypothetical protein